MPVPEGMESAYSGSAVRDFEEREARWTKEREVSTPSTPLVVSLIEVSGALDLFPIASRYALEASRVSEPGGRNQGGE